MTSSFQCQGWLQHLAVAPLILTHFHLACSAWCPSPGCFFECPWQTSTSQQKVLSDTHLTILTQFVQQCWAIFCHCWCNSSSLVSVLEEKFDMSQSFYRTVTWIGVFLPAFSVSRLAPPSRSNFIVSDFWVSRVIERPLIRLFLQVSDQHVVKQ